MDYVYEIIKPGDSWPCSMFIIPVIRQLEMNEQIMLTNSFSFYFLFFSEPRKAIK